MRRAALVAAALLTLGGTASPALAQGTNCTTKQVMDAFVPLFYEKRDVRTAFMNWVHEDYIQHNPVAKDGRDNAIAALEPFWKAMPGLRYTVARVIIEGDMAVVHNKLQMNPTDRGSASRLTVRC